MATNDTLGLVNGSLVQQPMALTGGVSPTAATMGPPAPNTRDQQARDYLSRYADVNAAYNARPAGTSLVDFANDHWNNYGAVEGRSWGGVTPNPAPAPNPVAQPVAQPPAPTPTAIQPTAPTPQYLTKEQVDAYLKPPPPTDYAAMFAAAMKAAGVGTAPPPPAPPPVAMAAPVSYNPTFGTVNADTDLAASHIRKLMEEGSPILERARSLAEQRANTRGLINSSIGVGAGTTAMLDVAGNIGSHDAGVYSQQRLSNQDAANQMELARGNSLTSINLANARASNDFGMAGYDDSLQRGRMNLENQFNTTRSIFDAGVGEQKDYRTADLNDRNDARSSDRTFNNQWRLNDQSFGNQRTLDSEGDFRREGIADRARTSDQRFTTSERIGNQQFVAGENAGNRTFQTGERLAGQQFTAGENTANRTFTSTENQLNRDAATTATAKGLTGTVAQNAATQVASIMADPNIPLENKQALIDRVWDNARTAQGINDRVNGTNLADIFPGGAANPRPGATTPVSQTPVTAQPIGTPAIQIPDGGGF